jgi:hypothetical protein
MEEALEERQRDFELRHALISAGSRGSGWPST